jgi:recombination protein RecT
MPPETVSNAVAQRQNTPGELIKQYSSSFASVLPSHVKAETWVRLAQGALKKGKRIEAPNPKDPDHPNHGRFELEVAAASNPGAFLAALLDAARLGLEPGTEAYYLTPRKVKGKREILGIVGYQGYVELMYRAGAVSSVVVQVVRQNDEYHYQRGLDRLPVHRFTPFAREAERGSIIGAYAYAEMLGGAVSQVVELNADDIARIRAVNPASGSEYSPWVNWEAAMWMKSAARQLRKWVPTSAEFRKELARAAGEAQRVATSGQMPAGADAPQSDVIEGEFDDSPVHDATDWPEVAEVPGGARDE